MIIIDTREQFREYICEYLNESGVYATIEGLPHGIDYIIANGNAVVGVQRKTSKEIFTQISDISNDVLPSLQEAYPHCVLVIEENHGVGRNGKIIRNQYGTQHETGFQTKSYYNFLEMVRKRGIKVITTQSLDHTIWWLISYHDFISKDYSIPPPVSGNYTPQEQALGALCAIKSIGKDTAKKILSKYSLRQIAVCTIEDLEDCGIGKKKFGYVQDVLDAKLDQSSIITKDNTTLVNIKTCLDFDPNKNPDDVYIGRYHHKYGASKWKNPWMIGINCPSREIAVKNYRDAITHGNLMHLLDDIHELAGKRLGCWCLPDMCHGQVLLDILSERENQ